jgi:hypothetical protein
MGYLGYLRLDDVMTSFEFPVVVLCWVCLMADDKPVPKFPIGKDTTYVTGPLDKDGYIDYEAALNDLLGKGITPDKNANVLLWRAFGPTPEGGKGMPAEFFKRLGIAEPPKDGDYFIGLTRFMKDYLKLAPDKSEAVNEQLGRASQRPWSAKEYPDIAAWLRLNEKPLTLIVEAARLPEYFNPVLTGSTEKGPGGMMGALLPSVQKCREAATALLARAMIRTADGEYSGAWQDLLACHRLGRLVARGATLIEGLVGIAINQVATNADLAYLDRAKLNSRQIQDCLKELRALAPMPPMADKIDVAERIMFLDSLEGIRRHGIGQMEALAGGAAKKPTPEELKALEAFDWAPALRNGNRWYDKLAAALRHENRPEREKELEKIEGDLRSLKAEVTQPENLAKFLLQSDPPDKSGGEAIGNALIGLLAPAIRNVQSAYDRSEQVQRSLYVAFALAAYQRDQGRYPAKLIELAPKYLAAVPDDIFSGKPLIYKPTEKGYLLYSVGRNGKDDGGRTFGDEGGDDLPVRMPLPEVKPNK